MILIGEANLNKSSDEEIPRPGFGMFYFWLTANARRCCENQAEHPPKQRNTAALVEVLHSRIRSDQIKLWISSLLLIVPSKAPSPGIALP